MNDDTVTTFSKPEKTAAEPPSYPPAFCHDCGWCERVDEDGCCLDCGRDAIGTATDKLAEDFNELHRRIAELEAVVKQRDAAIEAGRKMGYLLHRLNDDGHKRRANEIDQILRDGGVS